MEFERKWIKVKNYRAELTGVFGDPVDANPTGAMEEAAYEALGLPYRYLTMKVAAADLGAAFAGAKAIGMKGLNLTMPHKVAILPYLDELTPAAALIGAVNTVLCRDGSWIGENTDGKGFVASLERAGISLKGKRAAILGAGGAARAIAVECALAGAGQITVINRSEDRGRELAGLIGSRTPAEASYLPWTAGVAVPSGTQLLIQATSIGLYPNAAQKPDIDYCSITPDMVVSDVVFQPAKTLFLQEAERRGAAVITGIGMLVQQGALNFTLWTGQPAPVSLMYDVLSRELEI